MYNVITQVKALDGKRDGTGAFVRLVSGGPGNSTVSLSFDSQFNRPVNFTVVIYAKPRY